eukprot:gene17121-744_t
MFNRPSPSIYATPDIGSPTRIRTGKSSDICRRATRASFAGASERFSLHDEVKNALFHGLDRALKHPELMELFKRHGKRATSLVGWATFNS